LVASTHRRRVKIRSFIHVGDVCAVIRHVVCLWDRASATSKRAEAEEDGTLPGESEAAQWSASGGVYNMGGPEGLSRVGLANTLAAARPDGALSGTCSLDLLLETEGAYSHRPFMTSFTFDAVQCFLLLCFSCACGHYWLNVGRCAHHPPPNKQEMPKCLGSTRLNEQPWMRSLATHPRWI